MKNDSYLVSITQYDKWEAWSFGRADWAKISFLSLHLRLKKNVFCIPILMMEEHEKESTDLLLGWKVGSRDLFQMQ